MKKMSIMLLCASRMIIAMNDEDSEKLRFKFLEPEQAITVSFNGTQETFDINRVTESFTNKNQNYLCAVASSWERQTEIVAQQLPLQEKDAKPTYTATMSWKDYRGFHCNGISIDKPEEVYKTLLSFIKPQKDSH